MEHDIPRWPKQKTLKFYESSFNGILHQYLFKINIHERLEHKFDILLVISGILTIAIINLYFLKNSFLWVIPILLIAVVYSFSISHIFPKAKVAPWYSRESFKDLEKKITRTSEDIYQELIFEMYYLINQEDEIRNRNRNYITTSIYFLTIGIFSMIFTYIFPNDLIINILLITFISPVFLILFLIHHRIQEEEVQKLIKEIDENYTKYINSEEIIKFKQSISKYLFKKLQNGDIVIL